VNAKKRKLILDRILNLLYSSLKIKALPFLPAIGWHYSQGIFKSKGILGA
jgi:hypothetical protein